MLRDFGVPVPRGIAGFHRRRGGEGREGAGRPGLGGEGADPCRRPRQGRRRQSRQIDRRREERSRAHARRRRSSRHQTGPQGKQVHRLYIEEGSAIAAEFYLSLLVDRETSRVAIVVSTEGGMDIEEVAHETPEKILTFSVDPATGICPHHVRRVSQALELDGDLQKQMSEPADQALPGLRRQGHEPARDQSADRHQGQQARLPRRQGRLRRQRALSPPRYGRSCAT